MLLCRFLVPARAEPVASPALRFEGRPGLASGPLRFEYRHGRAGGLLQPMLSPGQTLVTASSPWGDLWQVRDADGGPGTDWFFDLDDRTWAGRPADARLEVEYLLLPADQIPATMPGPSGSPSAPSPVASPPPTGGAGNPEEGKGARGSAGKGSVTGAGKRA
ncbi:MAG: hypothetical protein GX442_08940 [Candidatus Riflebacteria bacterium]|nr:hypothetical protein [Candidatus Riflebacteria bacterium]